MNKNIGVKIREVMELKSDDNQRPEQLQFSLKWGR